MTHWLHYHYILYRSTLTKQAKQFIREIGFLKPITIKTEWNLAPKGVVLSDGTITVQHNRVYQWMLSFFQLQFPCLSQEQQKQKHFCQNNNGHKKTMSSKRQWVRTNKGSGQENIE